MPIGRAVARLLLVPIALAAPVAHAQPVAAPPATVGYVLEPWLDGLALPVAVAVDPDGSRRVLIVGLEGVVRTAEGGAVREAPFLDLRARVTARQGEQGLYSVALEPAAAAAAAGRPRHVVAAFAEIATGDLIVAAYPVDAAAWTADPGAEVELLRVPMPEPFHHGGQVRFGPDGALYASVGTGERAVRVLEARPWSAQSSASLRGTLTRVRLLPDGDGGPPYAVPPDNPFVGAADLPEGPVRPEVWALGFRNPWKFAFDPATGEVLVADVGEDRWEEVNRVSAGGNHGWPIREGPECLELPHVAAFVAPECAALDFDEPWIAYAHLDLDPNGGLAVVGGVVVADPTLPALRGRYVFGDFGTGRVWAWDDATGRREVLVDSGLALTAIEAGPDGAVLLVGVDGRILRLRAQRGSAEADPQVR